MRVREGLCYTAVLKMQARGCWQKREKLVNGQGPNTSLFSRTHCYERHTGCPDIEERIDKLQNRHSKPVHFRGTFQIVPVSGCLSLGEAKWSASSPALAPASPGCVTKRWHPERGGNHSGLLRKHAQAKQPTQRGKQKTGLRFLADVRLSWRIARG